MLVSPHIPPYISILYKKFQQITSIVDLRVRYIYIIFANIRLLRNLNLRKKFEPKPSFAKEFGSPPDFLRSAKSNVRFVRRRKNRADGCFVSALSANVNRGVKKPMSLR